MSTKKSRLGMSEVEKSLNQIGQGEPTKAGKAGKPDAKAAAAEAAKALVGRAEAPASEAIDMDVDDDEGVDESPIVERKFASSGPQLKPLFDFGNDVNALASKKHKKRCDKRGKAPAKYSYRPVYGRGALSNCPFAVQELKGKHHKRSRVMIQTKVPGVLIDPYDMVKILVENMRIAFIRLSVSIEKNAAGFNVADSDHCDARDAFLRGIFEEAKDVLMDPFIGVHDANIARSLHDDREHHYNDDGELIARA